ncbi:5-formyltetrahydrofolate cyclo-ligase [Clostridium sp. D2Q-11]|uniref:5-formyltetrahydrofolate cyclo-ligase n=1 Tax=Anaeromonas frigoriresistens TaxID=2683708 RepID=A0A942UTC4_9FIRM|nr:5-formyltetrahydrofolate cyclo-ligase [Anaeromonas frigoriresistens]MBS4537055.1 5-formyltetrahydrofolate cyclo-ligase [Anaeromonas frigoriresistens]
MDTNAKEYLRKKVLKKRDQLNRDDVDSLSGNIISYLMRMPQFQKSKAIMVYLSFKNEVDTFKLIELMMEMNKTIIVPYTDKKENVLIPSRLKDLGDSLSKNPYGYLEPKEDALDPIKPKEIDLVIVPGLVFDKLGNRIGYGGGYYDKLLSQTDAFKVAVAYDFQIFPRIIPNKHDIPVDYIVTPTKIIMGVED